MRRTIGHDQNRDMHWLRKVMQQRKLAEFIDVIPAEGLPGERAPTEEVLGEEEETNGATEETSILPTTFYTEMFLHFIRAQDFGTLAEMIKRTATHVTEANVLIEELEPLLKKEGTKDDQNLMDSLHELYNQLQRYRDVFSILLRMRDNRVFQFIKKHPTDFPINPIFGQMLRIHARSALLYLLKKHEN